MVGPNFIRRRGRNTMTNRPVGAGGGCWGVAIQNEKKSVKSCVQLVE